MPLTTYGDHRWTCRAHATARVARASCPGPSDGAQLPRERLPRAEPWSGGSPDPIPNSAVKPHLAESTAAPGRGRTGRSARRGRFFCVPAALTGRPSLPMLRLRQAPGLAPCLGLGAARRPLGPKAAESEMRQGLSLTSSGEQVRQNCIIIWTPCRVSFLFQRADIL